MIERKKKVVPDDPEQSKRFIETAEEVGADKDLGKFEMIFKKVALPKRSTPSNE